MPRNKDVQCRDNRTNGFFPYCAFVCSSVALNFIFSLEVCRRTSHRQQRRNIMFKKRIGSIVKKKKGNQEAPMAAVVVSETSADDGEEIGEDREEEGTEVALEEPDDGDKEGRGTEGAPSETQAQVEIDDDDDTEDEEEEDNEEEEDTEDEEEENTEAELSEVQAQEEPDDAVDNDSDDILQMLEDMEIPEFELSEDEGGLDDDDEEEEKEDVVEAEPETRQTFELVDWAARARREEIYSKRYRPTKAERKEFKEMAAMLGVASSKGMLGMALRSTTAIGQGMENTDNIHTLFFGGTSIMLKYGFVEWNENACGLILCTDGFALTYRNFNSYNPLEKRYETCQFWTSVDFCEKLDSKSFAIQLKSGQRYEFKVVEDGGDLGSWLKVLEKTLVQFHLHKGEASFTETLGWQYKVIHKAGYSAAVTGDLDILGKSSKLNKLDTYNELAPLHYAVQQEEYNIQVIAALLEKGADPNFQDYDGRSAMYYGKERNFNEHDECYRNSHRNNLFFFRSFGS